MGVSYSFQQPQSNISQWYWRCSGFFFFNLAAGDPGMFSLWKSTHLSHFSVGTTCSMTHDSLHVLLPITSSISPQTIPSSHPRLLSTPWPHQAISHLNLHANWISSFCSVRGWAILITQGLTSDDPLSEKAFLPTLASLYYITWSFPPSPHHILKFSLNYICSLFLNCFPY